MTEEPPKPRRSRQGGRRSTSPSTNDTTMGRQLVSLDWAMKKILRNKANFGVLEGFLSELLGPISLTSRYTAFFRYSPSITFSASQSFPAPQRTPLMSGSTF